MLSGSCMVTWRENVVQGEALVSSLSGSCMVTWREDVVKGEALDSSLSGSCMDSWRENVVQGEAVDALLSSSCSSGGSLLLRYTHMRSSSLLTALLRVSGPTPCSSMPRSVKLAPQMPGGASTGSSNRFVRTLTNTTSCAFEHEDCPAHPVPCS